MNPSTNFCSQFNGLLRKNLIQQKRDTCKTVWLFLFPLSLVLSLSMVQTIINNKLSESYSPPDSHSMGSPTLLQVPAAPYRAVRTVSSPFVDLASESCRSTMSCPVTFLFTGDDRTFGLSLVEKMLPESINLSSSQVLQSLDNMVLGSETAYLTFQGLTVISNIPLYSIQRDKCSTNSTFINLNGVQRELRCVPSLCLWRNSSSQINDELFKGYNKGNLERKINEFVAAYNFSNSNKTNFNVTVWYNSTRNAANIAPSINLVSNAYIGSLLGENTKLILGFVKGMPGPNSNPPKREISSALGILIFASIIMQLFSVVVTSLVREKELKHRMMMKVHGLSDHIYWVTSYVYFLILSMIYMLCLAVFGSVVGIGFFTLNDIKTQLLFYFIYINLQISLGFLMAHYISHVKVATVVAFAFVYGSRLLGKSLFEFFVEHHLTVPSNWITMMELYPGFSLYRGIYEFAQYALIGSVIGSQGIQWSDLSDTEKGLKNVLVIMLVEWMIIMLVAYCIDQPVSQKIFLNSLSSPRNTVKKRILLVMINIFKNSRSKRQESSILGAEIENHDASKEREKVDKWLHERGSTYAVICDNLTKVLPGKPEKIVKGLSLAVSKGECFGILGPSSAHKTSIINMMIGIEKPTFGKVFIEDLEVGSETKEVYNRMGYCPKKDILWGTLTGQEHLLFYGRLRNLNGSDLTMAVRNSLESVQLISDGLSDKIVNRYSNSEKRRLSIAISLLGDPKVVYMDEPTMGLDWISRKNIWNVALKPAKQDRTIILATNSAEAEFLCDRIMILVNGGLRYIGSPLELRARYEATSMFSVNAAPHHAQEVEDLVYRFYQNARKIHQISGMLKLELPNCKETIEEFNQAILSIEDKLEIHEWGVTPISLEEILSKMITGAADDADAEQGSVSGSGLGLGPGPFGDQLRFIETRLQNLNSRLTAMELWIAAQPGPSCRPFAPEPPTHSTGGVDSLLFAASFDGFDGSDPTVVVEDISTRISSYLTSVETSLQSLDSRIAIIHSWITDRRPD